MRNELPLSDIPGKPVLIGVAGSHAFGMATAASDVDFRGCYVIPTREFFHLVTPPESFSHNDPDVALHEVGRLLRMAAAANPTALEALFYTNYVIGSPIGNMLLASRELFITNKIRDTHLGFARSQFEKMKKRDGTSPTDTIKRTAKHARHTLRVIRLTEKVLTTGSYDLLVDNPDEIFAFGELEHAERIRKAEYEIERIKNVESILPPEPDMKAIDDLLVQIREMSL